MDTGNSGARYLEVSFKIEIDKFNEILGDTDLTLPLERAAAAGSELCLLERRRRLLYTGAGVLEELSMAAR